MTDGPLPQFAAGCADQWRVRCGQNRVCETGDVLHLRGTVLSLRRRMFSMCIADTLESQQKNLKK